MITHICPTCECSLVRLGIAPQEETSVIVEGEKYYFCCEACHKVFLENPHYFIEEVKDIHVCPVCLAEKITVHTVSVPYKGSTIRFCRCPFCEKTFKKDPDFYIRRLKGKSGFKGLFSKMDTTCCIGKIVG